MCQVVIDLTFHQRYLLCEDRGQIRIAAALEAIRLVRQDRERRLEPVRKITRLADRAPYHRVAVREQGVQIVHERLHLAGIVARKLTGTPLPHVREPAPHRVEWHDGSANDDETSRHGGDGQHGHDRTVLVDDNDRRSRTPPDVEDDHPHGEQPDRPERGAKHHPSAKRSHF